MSKFSYSDPVFSNFAFYGTASVAKMMAMSFWTALKRGQRQAFANPEDLALAKDKSISTTTSDEVVERVRRNHLNDIENIVPFVLVGFFYTATNPDAKTALWHFRVFFLSRVLHTLSYQFAWPQPSRAIAFFVGLGTTISMGIRIFRQGALA